MSESDSTAQDFLRSGNAHNLDLKRLAHECHKLVHLEVQKSASSGLKLARRFVKLAQGEGKFMAQISYRALGWAYHANAKYRLAEQAYLTARKLAERMPLDRARIDRTLIDVYMYIGDLEEARRRSRLASVTFRRLGALADEAKTDANYANLLHRQDRHLEAADLYRSAGATLKSFGMKLSVALCNY